MVNNTHRIKGKLTNNRHIFSSILNGIRVSSPIYFVDSEFAYESKCNVKMYKIVRFNNKIGFNSTCNNKSIRLFRTNNTVLFDSLCMITLVNNVYLSDLNGFYLSSLSNMTISDIDKNIK